MRGLTKTLSVILIVLLVSVVSWVVATSNPRGSSELGPKPASPAQGIERAVIRPISSTPKAADCVAGQEQSPTVAVPQPRGRLDIARLRGALQDGDWERFRDLNGILEEADAVVLYSLFSEIPASFTEQVREEFRHRIVQLLSAVPGDSALPLLLDFISHGSSSVESKSWTSAVICLGFRRYAAASPYLEMRTFGEDYKGRTIACSCLLIIDPARYMARTSQAMLSDPNAATHYLAALRNVSVGPAKLDISEAVPALQQLFRMQHREARHHRPLIVETLMSHASKHKSEPTRAWLLAELRSVLEIPDKRYTTEEREAYQGLLDQLK